MDTGELSSPAAGADRQLPSHVLAYHEAIRTAMETATGMLREAQKTAQESAAQSLSQLSPQPGQAAAAPQQAVAPSLDAAPDAYTQARQVLLDAARHFSVAALGDAATEASPAGVAGTEASRPPQGVTPPRPPIDPVAATQSLLDDNQAWLDTAMSQLPAYAQNPTGTPESAGNSQDGENTV